MCAFWPLTPSTKPNQTKPTVLGHSSWIASNERHTNNQVMTICYFRSVEGLHAFAHGPIHRKAWYVCCPDAAARRFGARSLEG